MMMTRGGDDGPVWYNKGNYHCVICVAEANNKKVLVN